MNATFAGNVSSVAGEIVTITVTYPDQTKETLQAQTLPDQSFSTSKAYTISGNYTAQAHLDASNQYKAWDSQVAQFTIALQDRTGTFTVTLS